jgi:hypothetical protein
MDKLTFDDHESRSPKGIYTFRRHLIMIDFIIPIINIPGYFLPGLDFFVTQLQARGTINAFPQLFFPID